MDGDVHKNPAMPVQLEGHGQPLPDADLLGQFGRGRDVRRGVPEHRQSVGVTGLDQRAQTAPHQCVPPGCPCPCHVDGGTGVVLGDVVEVVAHGAQHVLGRVVLEQFEQFDDRCRISDERGEPLRPGQAGAGSFTDQPAYVFVGVPRPLPQAVHRLRVLHDERSDAELGGEDLRQVVHGGQRRVVRGQAMGGDEHRVRVVVEGGHPLGALGADGRMHLAHGYHRIGVEMGVHHVGDMPRAVHQLQLLEAVETVGDEPRAFDRQCPGESLDDLGTELILQGRCHVAQPMLAP